MCGFSVYTGGDMMLRLSVVSEFQKIKYRGPDNSVTCDFGEKGWMGFHRLKIIDKSDEGNQPLIHRNLHMVANGEVYNYQSLMEEYKENYIFQSESDCEVIIPMFMELGMLETARRLDAEFVCVLYDSDQDKYLAARDPIGIRPMFYGYASDGKIMFASEMKALSELCEEVKPFPPGHIYDGEKFESFMDIANVDQYTGDEMEEVFRKINVLLTKGVEKRLHADVPVGFL
ncbi:MAG: asparagine synthetase B, partial [Bacteroidetes bacterium]